MRFATPSFAGMTVVRVEVDPITTVIPAKAGIQTELASGSLYADPTRLDRYVQKKKPR